MWMFWFTRSIARRISRRKIGQAASSGHSTCVSFTLRMLSSAPWLRVSSLSCWCLLTSFAWALPTNKCWQEFAKVVSMALSSWAETWRGIKDLATDYTDCLLNLRFSASLKLKVECLEEKNHSEQFFESV